MTTSIAPARQPTGLTKHQTRSTLAFLNWNTALRNVFATVCGSSSFIFVAFALKLGVAKEQMGLLASLSSAACIMQMAGLLLSNRVRNKKRMIVALSIAEPFTLLVAIGIIFLLPLGWRIYGLAIATFASAAVLNLTRPLADDWTASAIPSGLRENFLGRRLQIMNAIGIITTLVCGVAADNVQQWGTVGLAALVAIGAIIGVVAALPLRYAVLPSVTARASVTSADMKSVLVNKPFRRYMAVIMLIELPFCLGAPYYQVFNLQVLHLNATKIAFITVGYLAVRVVLAQVGARLVSRLGSDRMLSLVGILYTVFFATYILTAGGGAWPIFVGWILVGIGDSVFGVAQGTALYSVIPHTPARSAYFAVFNLIFLTTFGLGGVAGMYLLQFFKQYHFSLGPWTLDNFHCFYAFIFALMAICSCMVRLIHLSPKSTDVQTQNASHLQEDA